MSGRCFLVGVLFFVLFCGCLGNLADNEVEDVVGYKIVGYVCPDGVEVDNLSDCPSSTSTTSTSSTTTSTTSSTSTSTSSTSTTTSSSLPEFLDAQVHGIGGGVSIRADLVGVFGKLSAPEDCDGEPCGSDLDLVPVFPHTKEYDKSLKFCVVAVRLSNFGGEDVVVDGSFSVELADGDVFRWACNDRYDPLGYYFDCSGEFVVSSGSVWVNKLIFMVPRDAKPLFLIYQSPRGVKYRYDLREY